MKQNSLRDLYLTGLKDFDAAASVRKYARRPGFSGQEQTLNRTLHEASAADKKLTSLAESYINESAKTAR